MDYKKDVIYQIYPKSFQSTTGKPTGDLRGVIKHIPYLKKLGIKMVWFNPFFTSPQKDNGYDIADYRAIDPIYGTMDDYMAMAKALRDNGIELMLDMVFNHTSTEHIWFQKALAGDKKYQDYYILRPGKPDGSLPTNWESKFGGPAWNKFGDTDLYYLCLYDKTQADLDWRNPDVRAELSDIVNFWMTKGVTGFRFDVINVIGKDEILVDAPPETESKKLYTDKPIVHTYLKELNQNSFGQDPEIVTVGEMSSTTIENCIEYTNPDNHELTMVFTFHHLKVDYENGQKWTKIPFDFTALKNILFDWQVDITAGNGWNALFWNCHDQPRALNRFGSPDKYRVESAKMLAAALHLLRGTPYIYMGEEIGMVDPDYSSLSQYDDIETFNAYKELTASGLEETAVMDIIRTKSRDNARIPMPWDDSEFGSFSTVTPWLTNPKTKDINVKKELESGSIFKFYQQLIQLRHDLDVISDGDITPYSRDHDQVFAYIRRLGTDRLLVLNNFYEKETEIEIPKEFVGDSRILLANYDVSADDIKTSYTLRAYETLALYVSE